MPLDSNWQDTKGVGKLTRNAYQQVARMYNERFKYSSAINGYPVKDTFDRYSIIRDTDRDSVNISRLLDERYLDLAFYDSKNGDFSGLEYNEIKTWENVNDILQYIGDTEEAEYSGIRLQNAAWNWQKIRMLNTLNYIKEHYLGGSKTVSIGISAQERGSGYSTGNTPDEAWANAVASYNNADWHDGAEIFQGHYIDYGLNFATWPYNYYVIRRVRCKLNLTNTMNVPVYTDIYVIHDAVDGYHVSGVYDNPDYNTHLRNKAYKIFGDIYINPNETVEREYGYELNDITLEQPQSGSGIVGYKSYFFPVVKPVWEYKL